MGKTCFLPLHPSPAGGGGLSRDGQRWVTSSFPHCFGQGCCCPVGRGSAYIESMDTTLVRIRSEPEIMAGHWGCVQGLYFMGHSLEVADNICVVPTNHMDNSIIFTPDLTQKYPCW